MVIIHLLQQKKYGQQTNAVRISMVL